MRRQSCTRGGTISFVVIDISGNLRRVRAVHGAITVVSDILSTGVIVCDVSYVRWNASRDLIEWHGRHKLGGQEKRRCLYHIHSTKRAKIRLQLLTIRRIMMLKIWNVEEINIWSGQGCGLRYPKRKGEMSGGTSRVDSVVREFIL